MRLSANPHDTHYHPIAAKVAQVLLDGERIRDVLWADEEAGQVKMVCRDEHLSVMLNPESKDGEVLTKIVSGKVEIEFSAPHNRSSFVNAVCKCHG